MHIFFNFIHSARAAFMARTCLIFSALHWLVVLIIFQKITQNQKCHYQRSWCFTGRTLFALGELITQFEISIPSALLNGISLKIIFAFYPLRSLFRLNRLEIPMNSRTTEIGGKVKTLNGRRTRAFIKSISI